MPVLGPKLLMNTSHSRDERNNSLSDGSVCEIAPLTKEAFNRYQQINHQKQDHILPSFKTNGDQSRKRVLSTGDRDQAALSGNETGSKRSKQNSTESLVTKTCNPVMENSVSSTNHDVVYKFTGPTPAEDFQVTYSIEERVRTAAFAIVYNNCKLSTEKFESLYDKPAPDFKTIFAWRQRLMTTGCLVDLHLEKNIEETDKPHHTNSANITDGTTKTVCKLQNPDEIIIPSDTDEEEPKNIQKSSRSESAETLFIGVNKDVQACTAGQQARSRSQSIHRRTRSNSREIRHSKSPETDKEKNLTSKGLRSADLLARQSNNDSSSDAVSYNSQDDNFLSRVYPPALTKDGRKRRKVKRRPIPATTSKVDNYVPNDVNTLKGYSTVKKTEQSPLVTGNIYTSNLRNMNIKTRENVDIDGYSSEYVPTKLGSTTKQNYQEFKDNVRKKGFWAKGNGKSLLMNRSNMSMDVIHKPRGIPHKPIEEPGKSKSSTVPQGYVMKLPKPINKNASETQGYATKQPKPINKIIDNFTKDDIHNFSCTELYLPFDKNVHTVQNDALNVKSPENTGRIFTLVQSNSGSKNRSILDIFDISDPGQKSPERNTDLEKYDNVRKMYENQWDDDDDALYNTTDCVEGPVTTCPASSPTTSIRAQSPTSNMLYRTEKDSQQQDNSEKNLLPDFIKDKHDLLLDMLKDFQNNEISQMVSPLKHGTLQFQSVDETNENYTDLTDTDQNTTMIGPDPSSNLLMTSPDPILNLPTTRLDRINNSAFNRSDPIPNINMNRSEPSQHLLMTRSDQVPSFSMTRCDQVPNRNMNRSEQTPNFTLNRPDPIQNLPFTRPVTNNTMSDPIPNSTMNVVDQAPNVIMNRSDSIPNLPMIRADPNPNLVHNRPGPVLTMNRRDHSYLNMTGIEPTSHLLVDRSSPILNLTNTKPDPIPTELTDEVLRLSEGSFSNDNIEDISKNINPSKKVRILENVTIKTSSPEKSVSSHQQNTIQHSTPKQAQTNDTKLCSTSPSIEVKNDTCEQPLEQQPAAAPVDFSNLLAGINTNTLLLALQNLQHMAQTSLSTQNNEETNTENQNSDEQAQDPQTINLTNDEEWEKESNRDGSIERQLEKMDGNTGDTPFLSDIFDPGPVIVPHNVVQRLNLNVDNTEDDITKINSHINENAPVIGNFKSFALPKPILLNRLKLTVKTADKPSKSSGKRLKRKSKVCIYSL